MQNPPKRSRRATKSGGGIAKGFVARAPYWDVDLGVAQEIRRVDLDVAPGHLLRNYWLLVSDLPFRAESLKGAMAQPGIWCQHIDSGHTITPDQIVTGRYLRIQRAGAGPALPLQGLDVHLPTPTEGDLPPATLTRSEQKRVRPANKDTFYDGLCLNYETQADATYTVSFDVVPRDSSSNATPVYAWWNGQLCAAEGFRAGAGQPQTITVTGTGSEDRLLFRSSAPDGTGPTVQNLTFKMTGVPKRTPRAGTPQPRPTMASAMEPSYGSLGGTLRRKAKPGQLDQAKVARCLKVVMGGDDDEIVFR